MPTKSEDSGSERAQIDEDLNGLNQRIAETAAAECTPEKVNPPDTPA
jgi:hypothetical protein